MPEQPQNLQDLGVLVPHFLLMRDGRIIPLADKMWEKGGKSNDGMIEVAFDFITTNIYYITDREMFGQEEFMETPYGVLLLGAADCGNTAQLMASLLYYKGVPCRMVFGYAGTSSHRWVEAFYKGTWTVFDTTNGNSFPTAQRAQHKYDALFFVTPFSFSLAKLPFVPPLFLP